MDSVISKNAKSETAHIITFSFIMITSLCLESSNFLHGETAQPEIIQLGKILPAILPRTAGMVERGCDWVIESCVGVV